MTTTYTRTLWAESRPLRWPMARLPSSTTTRRPGALPSRSADQCHRPLQGRRPTCGPQGRATSKTSIIGSAPAETFAVSYGYSLDACDQRPCPRAARWSTDTTPGRGEHIAIDGATLLSGGEYFPFGACASGRGPTARSTSGIRYGRADRQRDNPARPRSRIRTLPGVRLRRGEPQLSAALAAGQSRSFTLRRQQQPDEPHGERFGDHNVHLSRASHKLSSLSGATTKRFTYDAAGSTTQSGRSRSPTTVADA